MDEAVSYTSERTSYVVQWHDGNGDWINDGGAPEGDFGSLPSARLYVDTCEHEITHYGYRFRILKRIETTTESIVEHRPPAP